MCLCTSALRAFSLVGNSRIRELPANVRACLEPPGRMQSIANAVKRPGGRARLLHADNRSGAWVSVAEAVQSGQGFFVDLAIDCDSADRVDVVQKIAADLQVHGYRPVQIASGRPDPASDSQFGSSI